MSTNTESWLAWMKDTVEQLPPEIRERVEPLAAQADLEVRQYIAIDPRSPRIDTWLIAFFFEIIVVEMLVVQPTGSVQRALNPATGIALNGGTSTLGSDSDAILQAIQDLKDRLNEIDAADQAAIARTTSEGPEQQQILISNFQLAMEGSLAEIRNDLEEKSVVRHGEMTAKLAALEMNIGANGVGEVIRKLGQTMGQQINNMSSLMSISNATREKLANLDNMLAQMQAMDDDMKATLAEVKQVPTMAEKVVQETVDAMADVLNTKATELYRKGVSFTKSTTHDDPATLPGGAHPGLPAWVTNPMVKKVAIAVVVLLFIIIGIALFGGSKPAATTPAQTSSSLAPPATTTPSTPPAS